jgi:ArsR family transcriptional regulator
VSIDFILQNIVITEHLKILITPAEHEGLDFATFLGLISIYSIFSKGIIMAEVEFDKSISFDREAEILKVLGHPVRLKIVAGLMSQSCNVKKIWECLELPQATVSQHLALLKNKGIIEGRRDGVEVFYQVTSEEARSIVEALMSGFSCKP